MSNCKYCGGKFESNIKHKLYCNQKCANNRYRRDYRKKNLEKVRLYQRLHNKTQKCQKRLKLWKFYNKKKLNKQSKIWKIQNQLKCKIEAYTNNNHLNMLIRQRDNNCCVKCGSTENIETHHLIYRFPPHIEDCITVCRSCHHYLNRGEEPPLKILEVYQP